MPKTRFCTRFSQLLLSFGGRVYGPSRSPHGSAIQSDNYNEKVIKYFQKLKYGTFYNSKCINLLQGEKIQNIDNIIQRSFRLILFSASSVLMLISAVLKTWCSINRCIWCSQGPSLGLLLLSMLITFHMYCQ